MPREVPAGEAERSGFDVLVGVGQYSQLLSAQLQLTTGRTHGNRILIGPSFSTDRNAAFLAFANSGFYEESRLKDALKN